MTDEKERIKMKRKVVMAMLLLCGALPAMTVSAEELASPDPMEGIVYEDLDVNLWLTPTIPGNEAYISYVPEIEGAAYRLLCIVDGTGVLIKGWMPIEDANASNWELVIPEKINGKDVIGIEDGAFVDDTQFTGKITIPKTMQAIGTNAFHGCSGLQGVDFSKVENLKIGDGAFWECSGLTSELKFGKGVVIGASAFYGCTGLTGALDLSQVGENVDKDGNPIAGTWGIHAYAFYNCSGLNGELKLPAGITEIPEYIFYGCTNLKGDVGPVLKEDGSSATDEKGNVITIARGNLDLSAATTIGAHAFDGCQGFVGQLTLSNGLTDLGEGAFMNCSNLKSAVVWDKDKYVVDDGPQFNMSGMPLTAIQKDTFRGCKSLTGQLVLPTAVETIGNNAFDGCGFKGNLDFTTTASLTSIGNSAFENCAELTGGIDLSNATGLTSIGNSAFKGCNKMTGNLTLANLVSLKTIGDSAFEGSKLIGTLGLDGLTSLETIGKCAFKDAKEFTYLSLSGLNGLKTISESAFEGCEKLEGGVDSSAMPKLETIGVNAFKNCTALNGNLNLSGLSELIKIEAGAFENCGSLTANGLDLSASKKLRAIGENAFRNCTSLTGTLTVPSLTDADLKEKDAKGNLIERLTVIGNRAFENCNLTGSLDLSGAKKLTAIGDYAFNVEDAVKESRKATQANYRGQFTGVLKLPDSLTTIGAYAFYENGFVDEMKSGKVVPLKLPESLTTIGDFAFKSREEWERYDQGIVQTGRSNGISQLDMSKATSLQTIGQGAFLHCVFDGTLDLSGAANLTTIGDSAFNGCKDLDAVVLPGSLTNMGDGIFYDCTSLKELTLKAGMQNVNIGNVENYGVLEIHDEGVASVNSLPGYAVVYGDANSSIVAWAREHGVLVEENKEQESVRVSSVNELINAVQEGSDKVITLADGCYVLHDSLEIGNRIHLKLVAENPGMVEIVVEDTTKPVIKVDGAKDVTIEGCILGYKKELSQGITNERADASNANKSIIYVTSSSDVKVENCELWGAECAGISYKSVRNLKVNKGTIRDCTYAVYNQLATQNKKDNSNGVDIQFTECYINGNGAYYENAAKQTVPVDSLEDVVKAEGVKFVQCTFLNNPYGANMQNGTDPKKDVEKTDCKFYHNGVIANSESGVCLNGITWYVKDDILSIGYPLVMSNGDVVTSEKGSVLPYNGSVDSSEAGDWNSTPWAKWNVKEVKTNQSQGVDYPTVANTVYRADAEMEGDLTIIDGEYYFIEDGVMAKSKEAYVNDAWRWFEADGHMARNANVYLRSNGGKWVRYDENGEMVKGEYTLLDEEGNPVLDNNGNTYEYYFDRITGAMVKGPWILEDENGENGRKVFYDIKNGYMVKQREIVVYDKPTNVEGTLPSGSTQGEENVTGVRYYFDKDGNLVSGADPMFWVYIDGKEYWYEDWQRQGWDSEHPEYRGKEIYDPASDAWYWLDNNAEGAKAVSKDVYQESLSAYPDREDGTGKWVRYDKNGKMIKGWQTTPAGKYYFEEVTGAMAKGKVTIEGQEYEFDEVTGILKQ